MRVFIFVRQLLTVFLSFSLTTAPFGSVRAAPPEDVIDAADYIASNAFEQAQALWATCLRSKAQTLPANRRSAGYLERFIPGTCRPERKRVRASIRMLADASGATVPDEGVDLALRKRDSVLALRLATELQPLPTPQKSIVYLPRKCSGSLTKGLKAYNRGDYEEALCRWLPKARAGNAVAQYNMGLLWLSGLTQSTPRDGTIAADWFAASANQGNLDAMVSLAQLQIQAGLTSAGKSWLDLAARWGNQDAATLLSGHGWVVPQSDLLQAEQQRQQAEQQRQQQKSEEQALLALSVLTILGCALGSGCANQARSSAITPSLDTRYGEKRQTRQCVYWTDKGKRVVESVYNVCPSTYGD